MFDESGHLADASEVFGSEIFIFDSHLELGFDKAHSIQHTQ